MRTTRRVSMNRRHWVLTVVLSAGALVFFAAVTPAATAPAGHPPQDVGPKKEASKAIATESQIVLAQWNEIGRKLIDIAEDLPEAKYDYKPNPDSRSFVGQL